MSSTVVIPTPGARARWVAIGAAAGILVAALVAPSLSIRPITAAPDPSDQTPEHTISVTGTGRVVLVPDTAELRLGVLVQKPTAKAARAAAAESMTGVVAALRKLGIAEKDIQTSALSLSPVYQYFPSGAPAKITGYQLSNVVSVTVRDLDVVGDAIDDAIAAGATTLDGVWFRVDDSTKASAQARAAAMADAKARADALAAAAGVSIVGVSTISETVAPVPYPIPYAADAMAREAGTPVQPGTTEVSVTVSVVYRIG